MISAFRAVWPRWWVLLLVGALAIFAVHTFVWPSPALRAAAGEGLPETRFVGAAQRIGPFLEAVGRGGRGNYVGGQVLDLAAIALLGLWLAVGVRGAVNRLWPGRRSWLIALPLAAALVDTAEDAGLVVTAVSFPTQPIDPAALGFIVTLKFALYGSSMLLLAFLASLVKTAQGNGGIDHG